MIQADHLLAVTRRCELLDVARSTVYYHPTGIPSEDLALMHLLDEIHLGVRSTAVAAFETNSRPRGTR